MDSTTEYDLLLITDATASMRSYLCALSSSLPQIIAVSALTDAFANIGVLAYRDYNRGEVTEWSGWHGRDGTATRDQLIHFTKNLTTAHGGDWPEATKTALAKAHSVMRSEAKTLVLLYTDAPPHLKCNAKHPNAGLERDFLLTKGFDQWSPQFADWFSAVRTIGYKGAQVFVVMEDNSQFDAEGSYASLTLETGGTFFKTYSEPSQISGLTMSIIMTWLGVSKPGATPLTGLAAAMSDNAAQEVQLVQDEEDPRAKDCFKSVQSTIRKGDIDETQLREAIVPIGTPIQDFSKRYGGDMEYQALVVELLGKIIDEDVSAIALNPVFGSLWRTVCNDRTNEGRDSLIQRFGSSVDAITLETERRRMKAWLAESYDYKAEILETIEEVAEADRYPCVFLDPTLDWSSSAGNHDDNDSSRPLSSFTREELLEIGRSYDYKVLRRLGLVLTRLTYVASGDQLLAHIASAPMDQVPRIPLALAETRYNRSFWKILLHVVLPGTKIAARPAALLAALSIRMGMKPLLAVADSEMLSWSKNWNNIDIPETWNTNCLALILDADKDFRARRKAGKIASGIPVDAVFLSDGDRRLFARLVDFSMLKANLGTTLQARIGWTPRKTKVPIGPLVTCCRCKFPRSVTMMGTGGVCGLCLTPKREYLAYNRDKGEMIKTNVSKDQTEVDEAAWVECSMTSCRAQYVVYQVAALGVRPKCYYCRARSSSRPQSAETDQEAPTVECQQCLSRMIWPNEYRPAKSSESHFKCPACTAGRKTTVDVETTAHKLVGENGTDWLLRNNTKISNLFVERSLFKTVSALDSPNDFAAGVQILPETDTGITIGGKLVLNQDEVRAALRGWIVARRAEAGRCSLCSERFKKRSLRRACGRSGCAQDICEACRGGWYGLNARGRIINVAALLCPFCRRRPAPAAVSAGAADGLRYLGNLRAAVEESGAWVYAWCVDCGMAKPLVERVCARGAPDEVDGWRCDECKEKGDPALGLKKIRNCPGCGVLTEKLGGCDHIECSICDTHWCFFCGKGVGYGDIYVHMSREHGGWYAGGTVVDEDDDDGGW